MSEEPVYTIYKDIIALDQVFDASIESKKEYYRIAANISKLSIDEKKQLLDMLSERANPEGKFSHCIAFIIESTLRMDRTL